MEKTLLDILEAERIAIREIERADEIIRSYEEILKRENRDSDYYVHIIENIGKWYEEKESWQNALKKTRDELCFYIEVLMKGE